MRHQPTDQQPEPTVHYLTGLWVACCPTCGFQLTSAWTQARCERRAVHRMCPVCNEVPRCSRGNADNLGWFGWYGCVLAFVGGGDA